MPLYIIRAGACWLFGLVLFLALAGCRPEAGPSRATPPPAGLVKNYSSGSLAVEYRVSRLELTVAERLELSIAAVVPENNELRFPASEEKLGGFKVVEAHRDPPRLLPGGRVATVKRYLLEPFLAGAYLLPPLQVSSWPREKEEAAPEEVATEEVPVSVRSLLAAEEKEPAVGDILPPVAQPLEPSLLAAYVAGAAALLLALFFLWRWWRGRPAKSAPPPPPPHLRAYQALDLLLASELLARGEVKPFHFAVSDILRHYIEERFALQAPERTTEEFLADLGRLADQPGLIRHPHRLLLREFLTHCDLVKFAEHHPGETEITRMVALCRQFIAETEPAEVLAQTSAKKFAAGGIGRLSKPRGRRLG